MSVGVNDRAALIMAPKHTLAALAYALLDLVMMAYWCLMLNTGGGGRGRVQLIRCSGVACIAWWICSLVDSFVLSVCVWWCVSGCG